MQLCCSFSILWHCLSLGLEWKLTFSSPVATAEFSKFAGNHHQRYPKMRTWMHVLYSGGNSRKVQWGNGEVRWGEDGSHKVHISKQIFVGNWSRHPEGALGVAEQASERWGRWVPSPLTLCSPALRGEPKQPPMARGLLRQVLAVSSPQITVKSAQGLWAGTHAHSDSPPGPSLLWSQIISEAEKRISPLRKGFM